MSDGLTERLLAEIERRTYTPSQNAHLYLAARKIVDLHQLIPNDPAFCTACTTSWPCPTLAAVSDALGVKPW